MFKAFSTLFAFITTVITSLTAISESVDNVAVSINSATHALRVNAEELDKDAIFECEKKSAARTKKLADYKASLETEEQE